MCKKEEECGLLDDLSYGDMMEDLSSFCRSIKGDYTMSKLHDGYWERNNLPSVFEPMVKFGLTIHFYALFYMKRTNEDKKDR